MSKSKKLRGDYFFMFSENDERNGLIKESWLTVRERVTAVNPVFAKIVDEIDPNASFPVYLAYYPYGAIDADTESSFFPDMDGSYYRITDSNASSDVVKHLGYSKNNTPLGMVLEKQIECFVDLNDKKQILPWHIFSEGDIFPLTRILAKGSRIYAPNGLLSSAVGSRSVFMLPHIGSVSNHANLQKKYKIKNFAPKSFYDHWYIFREIIQSKTIQSDWRCCVLYFSDAWITKLHEDAGWSKLKHYLHEKAWHGFEYNINRPYYDMIFSILQQKRNLRPNPYLTDTAKHLFAIAIGAVPGYVPALSEEALPLKILQEIFVECYGLKKYIPTIMHPECYHFEKDNFPTYYSMQNPSTYIFSPTSRAEASTLFQMRELEYIMKVFSNELGKSNGFCSSESIMNKVANGLQFNYYHNKTDTHDIIRSSHEIFQKDSRFYQSLHSPDNLATLCAADAAFVRGCISISKT